MLCEVAPHALAEIGDSFETLLDFFEDAGYGMYLVERAVEKIRSIGYRELRERFEKSTSEFEDVIFLPEGVSF